MTLPFEALIFDVDGTLYCQGPLRRRMLLRLLAAYLRHPWHGLTTMRMLSAYRKAQETLRWAPPAPDFASAQIALAARRSGANPCAMAVAVETWMERVPLPLLPRCLRSGLIELLRESRRSGLRLAVFSDYPAEAKIEALGLGAYFDCVVCSRDPEVQRLKPDPRGLEVVAQRMGIDCLRTAYIGDRPEIDGAAACDAGMGSFIIQGCRPFPALAQLLNQTAPARAIRESSPQTAENVRAELRKS